ncbi:MAG: hypothetical protein COA85_01570 [Robiginitomaculum sp.]|nr:MAG: hypothetical protein COA85_01570 [Robiginitomaculum sp.]
MFGFGVKEEDYKAEEKHIREQLLGETLHKPEHKDFDLSFFEGLKNWFGYKDTKWAYKYFDKYQDILNARLAPLQDLNIGNWVIERRSETEVDRYLGYDEPLPGLTYNVYYNTLKTGVIVLRPNPFPVWTHFDDDLTKGEALAKKYFSVLVHIEIENAPLFDKEQLGWLIGLASGLVDQLPISTSTGNHAFRFEKAASDALWESHRLGHNLVPLIYDFYGAVLKKEVEDYLND